MKAVKAVVSMLAVAVAAMLSGCATCPNCVTVEPNVPFIAQGGLLYGINNPGPPGRAFDPYGVTIVELVPGQYIQLQDGGRYVLRMNPEYLAAQESFRAGCESMTKAFNTAGEAARQMQQNVNQFNQNTLRMFGR